MYINCPALIQTSKKTLLNVFKVRMPYAFCKSGKKLLIAIASQNGLLFYKDVKIPCIVRIPIHWVNSMLVSEQINKN